MAKNILFVAFEFPPLGGGGVQRSIKFVKYLPDFDIKPIVITPLESDLPFVMPHHPIDKSLLNQLSDSTIIERVHCQHHQHSVGKFKKWTSIYFSISEVFKKTWKIELEKKIPQLISQYKPDAVYVTMPPFAMGTLWKELIVPYGIPLVVDFRDAWSQWCVSMNGSYFHYKKKLKEERSIINAAAAVICTSDQIREDMLSVHPNISKEKFTVITNGFDDELNFNELMIPKGKEKFVIGYVGNFYYTPSSRKEIFKPWWKKPLHRMLNYVPRKEDWLYRSPFFFFRVVRQLCISHPSMKDRIEIHFAGKTPDWLKEQISEFGLEDLCTHHGYLNHEQVLAFQKNCDALLITSSKVIGGRDYSIAGKTFEYFTIGKPILAFVCEGAQKDILQESGMALIIDPDSVDEGVRKMFDFFQGSIPIKPMKENILKYHRRNLSQKLATVIKKVIAQH
jgi:glycosyltransferase involved in cell wall biosynthesis